jgi:hypothetical protein
VSPSATDAQSVPAQQLDAPVPQGSPVAVQVGPAAGPESWLQTRAPAGPRQRPAQQSSGATQGAPNGAQLLAQASAPVVSGRHRPPQHCAATEQGRPSVRQAAPADGPRQRRVPFVSARQLSALLAQQSDDFMQRSPMARHPLGIGGGAIEAGMGVQRAVPLGAAMQLPEQQFWGMAQRSWSGLQPEAALQREGPVAEAWQRPEQQSLSAAQSSNAG